MKTTSPRRLWMLAVLCLFATVARAQTTTPNLGLTLPTFNEPRWDVILNSNFSIIDGWTAAVPINDITPQAPNTVIGNASNSTARPTAIPLPSCSGANNALTWASGTGFGCNTISGGGGGGITNNPLTFSASGNGGLAGSTFNGAAPVTISWNSIGASPLAGSTNITTLGTVTAGTWNAGIIPLQYGGTGQNWSGSTGIPSLSSGTASLFNTTCNGAGNALTWSGSVIGCTTIVTGVTSFPLTMNNSGTGAASGATFNGSGAITLSYNTLGAAPQASPTFTGTVTIPALILSGITGGTSCLQANSSGAVGGTGTPCGSGGGSSALSAITPASASNTIANANNPQVWNWAQTTNGQTAFTFSETSGATGVGDIELAVSTVAGSTAIPLAVSNSLTGTQSLPTLEILPIWNTTGAADAGILENVTNTASNAASLLIDLQIGSTSKFKVDESGNLTATGAVTAGGSFTSAPSAATGALLLGGSATAATLPINQVGFFGPNAATFTKYALQWSATGPAAAGVMLVGAPASSISQITFGLVPNSDLANSSMTVNTQTCTLGGSCTVTSNTTNALTFNNSGSGAVSGTTFNGSAAVTISNNSIGASPTAGNTSLATVGTVTTGTWNATAIGTQYGGTGQNWSASSGIPELAGGTASLFNTTCSGATNALTWNSTTHAIGCNSISVSNVALSSITAATAANTIASGNNAAQIWNWALTANNETAFTFGETSASTSGLLGAQYILSTQTLAGSTAVPFNVANSLTGSQTLPAIYVTPTWNTTGVVDAGILENVTNTASGAGSLLLDLQVGGVSQISVDKGGNTSVKGSFTSAPAAGTASSIYFPGGTTNPGTQANAVGLIGPNTGTFTAYNLQWSSAGPSGAGVMLVGAPSSSTSQVTFGTVPNSDLTNSSLTINGDGTVLSGSGPTISLGGSGSLTLANAGAGTIFGNSGSSSAAPSYTSTPVLGVAGTTVGTLGFRNATSGTITLSPPTGALGTVTATIPANTGTIAELNLAQTWTANQTYTPALIDFSGATNVKLPVAAAFASAANGEIGYDTTNLNWHVWDNGADKLIAVMPASGLTSGDCVEFLKSTNSWSLQDAGAACGSGGGGAAFQVNGVALSSATTVNFENSAATDGLTLTFSNPSLGNVQLGFTGTLTNAGLANSSLTVNGDGTVLSGTGPTISLGSSGALTLVNASAGTALGNWTSSSAAPTYATLTAINPQTSTYQVLASDFAHYKTITVSSGTFTITLVASGTQPAAGQYINIVNYGSGVVTVARSGQNINGGTSSLTLPAATALNPSSATISSDGANYFASVDACPTCVTSAAALPAGGIMYGAGGQASAATSAGTAKQVVVSGGTGAPSMVDFPERYYIPAANCNNTTAGAGWSIGSGGTVVCRAGTNNQGGAVQITDTSTTFAQFTVTIPEDWDTGTDPYIRFYLSAVSDTTSGHTIIPQIKVSCPTAGNGTTTDDATFSAAQSSSTITLGASAVANGFYNGSNVQIGSTQMTGCIAGGLMIVQIGRATDTGTGAISFWGADITFPRLITVQAN